MNTAWGSARFVTRMLIFVVCSGALLSIGLPAYSAVYLYEGTVQQGTGGGAMWSFGHRATDSPKTPSGGWTQKASGEILFQIEYTPTEYQFTFDDVDDSMTLSTNDQILVNIAGLSLHNQGGSHAKIGSLNLNGTLTVGGVPSNSHDFLIEGELDFFADFTGTGLPEPSSSLSHGDSIYGTAYFQAANIAGQFNGVSLDDGLGTPDSELKFAVWGDNRSRTDDPNDPTTASEIKSGDGVYSDSEATDEGYSIGFDLVVHANSTIPEPSSILVWTLLGAVGVAVGHRGRGRVASVPSSRNDQTAGVSKPLNRPAANE